MPAPRPDAPTALSPNAVSLLFLLAAFAGAGCATVVLNPQVEPETLGKPKVSTQPSGLRLVVGHDPHQSLAAVSLIVGVGRAHDPPNRPGLARLVARLAVRARTREGHARDLYLTSIGAVTDDSIRLDDSSFHIFARKELWAEILAAELDLLADPLNAIDESDLRAELRTVRDPATDLHAFERGVDLLRRELFEVPSADADNGATASLDGVTLAEVRAFAARNYRPSNATLSIDGALPADVDAKVRTAIAARAFPAASSQRPPGFSRGSVSGARPVRVQTAPVDAPELWLGWALPSGYGPDAGRLELLLSAARSLIGSDLLRSDDPDIVSIRVSIEPGASTTILACRVVLSPEGDPQRAAKVVASLVSESWAIVAHVTSKDLRAANVHLYAIQGEETLADRAALWTRNAHYTGDPRFALHSMMAAIDTFDAASAYDFVSAYVAPPLVRGVFLRPSGAIAGRTAALALKPDRFETSWPAPPASAPPAATGPARTSITKRTLANGLTVIVASNDRFAMTTSVLAFHGGSATDEPPGAAEIAAATGDFSTADLICSGQTGCGVSRTSGLGEDVTMTGFVAERSMLPPILSHFGQVQNVDWVQWPTDAKGVRLRELLRRREAEPWASGSAALREALYPGTRWGSSPRLAQIETATSAAVKAWSDSHRAARNSAIIIVGSIEPELIMSSIEKELGSWAPGELPAVPQPQALPPRQTAPRVLVTRTPSARGTYIHFGCRLPPVTERDTVWPDLFAQALERTLDARLRRGLGIVRGVNVEHTSFRGGTSQVTGSMLVANDALPGALEELEVMFSRLGEGHWTGDATGARLDLELRAYTTKWLLDGASPSDLASQLVGRWNSGWSLDSRPAIAAALANPDEDSLAASARACHGTAVISIATDPATSVPTPRPPASRQAGREASQRTASSSAQ